MSESLWQESPVARKPKARNSPLALKSRRRPKESPVVRKPKVRISLELKSRRYPKERHVALQEPKAQTKTRPMPKAKGQSGANKGSEDHTAKCLGPLIERRGGGTTQITNRMISVPRQDNDDHENRGDTSKQETKSILSP
jgi:hypothetical protein